MRVALVALVALGPPVQAARVNVVAIGNNVGRPGELALRFAEQDAQTFADVMRRLGGARAQDVVTLTGAGADEARQVLVDVDARLAGDGALVVYYSGHADAAGLHLGDTTFAYEALREAVAKSRAKVRVLILDGCRSGGLTRVKGASADDSFTITLDDRIDVEGMAVMTSSASGEDSHESDRLRGSFFTHHLVGGLIGAADRDQDGRVTVTEAYAYAYRNTLRSSGRSAQLQHPTYAYDIKGRGDFVLTRTDAGPASGRLRLAEVATYLLHEGGERGPLRAEVDPEKAGTAVTLPEGRYFVQERHRDHYREYEVWVPARGELDLAGAPHRRVAYATLVRKGGASSASGMYVLGAVHGAALDGGDPVLGAIVAYALDLPWATLSLRGRFGQSDNPTSELPGTTRTLGAGLTAERVVDVRPVSLALGVLAWGLHRAQTFDETSADVDDRASWGMAFGVLGALELPLVAGVGLRVEGGPLTHVLRVAETSNGAQTGAGTKGRLSWWGAAGATVRF